MERKYVGIVLMRRMTLLTSTTLSAPSGGFAASLLMSRTPLLQASPYRARASRSSGFALSGSRFAFFRLRPIGLALRVLLRRGAVCRPLAIEAWEFRVAVPAYVSWPILAALQTRRARHDC